MENEKILRLEKELSFLEESLKEGIINEEEYTDAKERIEKKLAKLNADASVKAEPASAYGGVAKVKEQKEEASAAEPNQPEELPAGHDGSMPSLFKSKGTMLAFVILVAVGAALLLYSQPWSVPDGMPAPAASEPACFSDSECSGEGVLGICRDAGKADARCVATDDVAVFITILNDPGCSLCDASRMRRVISQLLPGAVFEEVAISSGGGEALAETNGITSLPAFIVNKSVADAHRFEGMKSTLSAVESGYLISPAASGAAYHFTRQAIPGKIEVFLLSGQPNSALAKASAQDVAELIPETSITVRTVSAADGFLDLPVTTFPFYLINNLYTVTGFQSPEMLKEKFCLVNDFGGCSEKLSESFELSG